MSERNGSSRGDSSHLKSYPLGAHEASLPVAEDWIYSSPLSSLHQLSLGVHGLLTALITFLMPIQQTLINTDFLACFLNCNPPAIFTFYEPEFFCRNLFSFANISILCVFCFACLICPDTLVLVSRSVGFGGFDPHISQCLSLLLKVRQTQPPTSLSDL